MKLRKRILIITLVALIVIAASVALSACGAYIAYECNYENSELYTIADHGEVEMSDMFDLDIKWFAGSVTVQKSDEVNTVTFYEENADDEEVDADKTMHYYYDGKKLNIRYGKSGEIRFAKVISKHLYVFVPSTITLQNVDIKTECFVMVTGITADEVSIGGFGETQVECTARKVYISAGGEIHVNCEASDVTIRGGNNGKVYAECTASDIETGANIYLNCTASEIEMKTQFGNITLICDALPKELNINTYAADVEMYLTNERAFSISYRTSGEFEYVFNGLKEDYYKEVYSYLGGVQPNEEYYYTVYSSRGNIKLEQFVEEQ